MSSFPYDIEAKRNSNYRQAKCCFNCKHYDHERNDKHCTAFLKEGVKFMHVNFDYICDKYVEAEE